MKHFKKKNFWLQTALVAVSFIVLTGMGKCGGGDANKKKVAQCVEAPAEKCSDYKQNDGKECELDPAVNKCRAKASFVQSDCQKISDKDQCQKDDSCVYKNDKCEDADENEAGNCVAIKVEAICNIHKARKEAKHCAWNATDGKCEVGPQKKVTAYTLTKLDKATTYAIDGNQLKGLTASGDGAYVYVVGSSPKELKSLKVTGGNWDGLGDWKLKDAADRGKEIDLSPYTVLKFAPTNNGILLQMDDNQGLVILEGAGAANTSVYAQSKDGSTTGGLLEGRNVPFFAQVATAAPDHLAGGYIYVAQPSTTHPTVIFRQLVLPLANDDQDGTGTAGLKNGQWSDSLKKDTGKALEALTDNFIAFAQNEAGDMFLGSNQQIVKLSEAKVGTTGAAQKLDAGAVTEQKDWNHSPAAGPPVNNDQGITALAAVGNFLYFGLDANGNSQKGGIGIKDMSPTGGPAVILGLGTTVNWIAVATQTPLAQDKEIVIGTDKGVVFYKNGVLQDFAPGKHLLVTKDFIAAHQFKGDYRNPEAGFIGDNLSSNDCVGAAQVSGGDWYFAFRGASTNEGGVYRFSVGQKDVDP